MQKLEALSIEKSFGAVRVLRGASITLFPGSAVCLLGSNGAGKTTFLRCLAGLARPDRGKVLLDGKPLKRAGSRVSVSLPETGLYGELTIEENLELLATVVGRGDVGQVMDGFLLEPWRKRRVRELSSGVGRRASLARAFLLPSQFLLLDEPFANLDRESGECVRKALIRAMEAGQGIALTGHDPSFGYGVPLRFVELKSGRIEE